MEPIANEQRTSTPIVPKRWLSQGFLPVILAVLAALVMRAIEGAAFNIATFQADVTPPMGHPCMGGGIAPASKVADPLSAIGFVLTGGEQPIVVTVVDWCEIRNDAYERWRAALAKAAGTTPDHVLISCVHQHDTPIADLEAERLLVRAKAKGSVCQVEFHEEAVQRVVRGLTAAMSKPRQITHFGVGQAKVEKVASNRRFTKPDGTVVFSRTSSSKDPDAHAASEGTIDPWLKSLSFWDGDQAVLVLHCYATHPMSYYGQGEVSADFPGLARRKRQAETPGTVQIYASGCSGNVTAGKYNDGSRDNRLVLADRLYQAMVRAEAVTQKHPLEQMRFRRTALRLDPRSGAGFTRKDLEQRLTTDVKPFGQCLAALGLSWRARSEAGHTIDLPLIDFGVAKLLLLPAESYVEFQLKAQELRPDAFVMVLGYGESAPGYIPIERAFQENDGNLHDWCWVDPGSERIMIEALEHLLRK